MSTIISGTLKRHLDVGAGTVAVWSIPICVDAYVNARLYSLRLFMEIRTTYRHFGSRMRLSVPHSLPRETTHCTCLYLLACLNPKKWYSATWEIVLVVEYIKFPATNGGRSGKHY